jgi:hypothetical protein
VNDDIGPAAGRPACAELSIDGDWFSVTEDADRVVEALKTAALDDVLGLTNAITGQGIWVRARGVHIVLSVDEEDDELDEVSGNELVQALDGPSQRQSGRHKRIRGDCPDQ